MNPLDNRCIFTKKRALMGGKSMFTLFYERLNKAAGRFTQIPPLYLKHNIRSPACPSTQQLNLTSSRFPSALQTIAFVSSAHTAVRVVKDTFSGINLPCHPNLFHLSDRLRQGRHEWLEKQRIKKVNKAAACRTVQTRRLLYKRTQHFGL